ncbi:MFS transporter [Roseateles sp. SL47]|uniref:MFS transporter n=1 Tax=Roseateles sp. SL47 TaxID=2995138 RepID=UPI00227012FB|nr:MFS transporter [Roseateles sp. SL47]WAC74466.1 MFS transporter [Roseateles sp. SL47]
MTAASSDWAQPGTPAYRRITVALFLAGFTTFSLLYSVQPLLPLFAQEFQVGAAASALSLSLATGCLAFAILCAGALSESMDRRRLMFASMTLAALLNLLASLLPSWHGLLLARAVEGLVLGGVPAVAMAYLAEEIHPGGLGRAMGQYVGGTAFGGMMGRVGVSVLSDAFGWRPALLIVSGVGLLAAAGFWWLLPPSKHFVRRQGVKLSDHVSAWRAHLTHPALPFLFAMGFLMMGTFVAFYNYAGFRLMRAPFSLSQSAIGLIFCAYLFGIVASTTAGGLSDRVGRAPALLTGIGLAMAGVLLGLSSWLPVVIVGIVLLTIGFFVAHSVSSAWVGALGGRSKGHAASLYLLAYYVGSSTLGAFGGWFWDHQGWPALVVYVVTLLVTAFGAALVLRGRTSRPAQ